MKSSLRIALLTSFGALALSGCGGGAADQSTERAAIEKIAAPAGSNWSAMVAPSEEGGMVMGNPDAPIKVVEYASITCSFCADFSKTAMDELGSDYIDSGRVSLEMRHFVRDPLDATVSAVLRCSANERYFPLLESAFVAQADLFAGAQANPTAGEQAMQQAPEKRFTTLAASWKLDEFFKARGVTEDQITACLSDVSNITKLEEITNKATQQHGVTGTPAFLINGKLADGISNWPSLRDRLRNMGAR